MMRPSLHCRTTLCALTFACLAAAPVLAQDEVTPADPGRTVEHVTRAGELHEHESFNEGRISLRLGVDAVTEYWFRGIFQENQGFILQPYLEAQLNVFADEEADGLNSIDLTVGIWNSFHGGPSGDDAPAGSGITDPTAWYEADLYGGVSATFLERWTAGVSYIAYTSPNDAFSTTEEVAFSLAFDDSDMLGDFALAPTLTLAVETDGGADGTGSEGIYLQIGIAPGFTLIHSEKYPVTLTIPVTVGLGLDDYYESGSGDDETFGFVDIGADLGVPLGCIPADYGVWTLTAGVHVIFLGENNREDNGDNVSVYGKLGLSLEY